MKKPVPPKVQKFPTAKQRRLERLLEQNSAGTITPKDKAALERLVAAAEQLMVANLKKLADFARAQQRGAPAKGIPVTVWVQPQPAER
jgi:hypothetical protein